jgi:hypothetical protein
MARSGFHPGRRIEAQTHSEIALLLPQMVDKNDREFRSGLPESRESALRPFITVSSSLPLPPTNSRYGSHYENVRLE